MPELSALTRAIWDAVRRVPRGRVATYGQIARLAGRPRHARLVGYALYRLPAGSRVPWHRVINARGEISQRTPSLLPHAEETLQRRLLEAEGVPFDAGGRVDLERYGYRPAAGAAPRGGQRGSGGRNRERPRP